MCDLPSIWSDDSPTDHGIFCFRLEPTIADDTVARMTAPFQVTRMDHVAIDITDVDQARQFYGGLFGLREIPRPLCFDFPGAWFETGSAVLHLVGRGRRDAEGKRHICLWVNDIEAAARAVDTAGFPLRWEDKYLIIGIHRFYTYDPDGNRVEVQGELSKAR